MKRIDLDARSLAFEDRGSGEPLLLLHSGFVADGMRPLAEDGGGHDRLLSRTCR